MKFYCDACHTKYAISDDKVRGKVLKVRCKNCGNVVTVREAVVPITGSLGAGRSEPHDELPEVQPPERKPAADAPPPTNWFYALNGQSFGPFTLEGLRRKYMSAEIGDATYVWHEWLGEWKPVASEPTFADALAMGHKIVPSRKTLGFTGPIEAIRVTHGAPTGRQEGVDPGRALADPKPAAAKPEPSKPAKPEPVKPAKPALPEAARRPTLPPAMPQPALPTPKSRQAPTPEARPLNDARAGNLERLRERLGNAYDAGDGAAPLPAPVGGEAVFTFAEGVTPASDASSQEMRVVPDVVDFSLPPRAKPAKPSPSSTSDILERAIGPTIEPPSDGASLAEDSGVVPFFPESPRLASQLAAQALGPQDGTSESLLIDMSKMNKAGRKRQTTWAIAGTLVLLTVVGVGIVLALRAPKEAPVEAKATQPGHKDELVIKRYAKEEVGKLAMLDLDEEVVFAEDEVEQLEPAEAEPVPTAEPKVAAALTPRLDKTPSIESAARIRETSPTKTSGKNAPSTHEPDPMEGATQAAEPDQKVDPLAALLAPRAGKTTEIRAPEDRLLAKPAEGLSKDEARKGFTRVKKSIAQCRERHNRYNAKLDAQKLKISLTVEPSGQVSAFALEPRAVQNTEFHSCMNSHRERWRFASFGGKSVVINTSVILQ